MEGKEQKKGLEFMAFKMNIAEIHLELAVNKEITPAEDHLLKAIEIGTIGARNSRNQICSKAEFFIDDLSERLGYKTPMKIWALLKSSQNKNLIIREKTKSKGKEILGLNPKVFGQILIDSQHEIEKKRHLKMVVDNSQSDVDNFSSEQTNRLRFTNEPFAIHKRIVCDSQTNRLRSSIEPVENIEENSSLDSFRFNLDSFRGQTGESFTLSGEQEREAHKLKVLKQLEDLKAGRLAQ